jgi:GDP-L-fucose synthase
MDHHNSEGWINIGTGEDLTIKELALTIADVVGYQGDVIWDTSKPDGTPRKLLNLDRINEMGWKASITLRQGIESVYADYLSHEK